jgi:hypothetical protein
MSLKTKNPQSGTIPGHGRHKNNYATDIQAELLLPQFKRATTPAAINRATRPALCVR